MTTTHTPGPWIATRRLSNAVGTDCYKIYAVTGTTQRVLIATTRSYALDRGTAGPAPHWSNARLIAAAPDLYAALKGLNDSELQTDLTILYGEERARQIMGNIRTAIAKAEGQE